MIDTEKRLDTEKKIFGWGKYEFTILWWFFFIWGLVFLDRLVMPFLAPVVMADLQITDQQYGLINTLTTGCYAVSAIFMTGFFEASGSRKKWLILLCLLAGVFACLGAVTQDVWQLLLTRAAVGFVEGPIVPIMFAMLIKESQKHRIALNSGLVNMGVAVIAITIGPIVVTQIAAHTNWRIAFCVAGLASIVASLFLIKVLREVEYVPAEKKESAFKTLGKLLKYRNVVICFVLGILCMAGYWTLMLYATLFFSVEGGQDLTSAGLIVGIMGVLCIVWTVVVPKVSDFIGRKPAVMLWFALCMIAPFVMFGSPTSMGAIVMYALVGGIPGAIFPFFQAIIPGESLPNFMLGTASGLITGVAEIIGGSAWPAVLGVIAANFGYSYVILSAGIAFAAAAALALLLKESKGQRLDDTPAT